MTRKLSLFMILLALLGVATANAQEAYSLTIMHTNDVHAQHDADEDGNGGDARLATLVNEIRAEVENTLLVDAGDRFTGSIYHSYWLGQDSARVMNLLAYDAMVLGSYEFTHGPDVLADFVDALEFPVVVANVDFSGLPDLDGQITPYVVLEVGGESIGVIGVTRTDARVRPITGATFNADYAGVVQAAADELTAEGVNKIVVLSHLGYFADLELATQVSGVDVIVGGDTANLLSNTLSPDEYDVEGPYPAVVESASGETALVVQGWQRNRVLGQLNITFDTDGLITAYDGDSILISAEVEPDPDMEALLEQLRAPLEDFRSQVLGETTVELIGEREVCRFEECAMGNLIADALRVGTGAQIGLQNGGGIRASIPTGEITVGGILDVLPFGNTYTTFELSGEDLIAALENSVSRTDQTEGTGRFLQVSGLRFSWDGSQPAGSRVVSVEVLNDDGEYETLDPDEEYVIATNDYLYAGGDDYTMFAENSRDGYDFGRTLDELVRTYVQGNSPITVGVEGRITRTDR